MAKRETTERSVAADSPQVSVLEGDAARQHRALGSAIWNNPEFILSAAARLRDSNAIIECRIRGGSMEPAIAKGARLQISLGEGAPYRRGEVVAFVLDGDICVHRVVHCGSAAPSGTHLITQGDACLCPDPPITIPQVLGRVSATEGHMGFAPTDSRPSGTRAESKTAKALLRLIIRLIDVDIRVAQFSARLATTIGQLFFRRNPVGGFPFKSRRPDTRQSVRR